MMRPSPVCELAHRARAERDLVGEWAARPATIVGWASPRSSRARARRRAAVGPTSHLRHRTDREVGDTGLRSEPGSSSGWREIGQRGRPDLHVPVPSVAVLLGELAMQVRRERRREASASRCTADAGDRGPERRRTRRALQREPHAEHRRTGSHGWRNGSPTPPRPVAGALGRELTPPRERVRDHRGRHADDQDESDEP